MKDPWGILECVESSKVRSRSVTIIFVSDASLGRAIPHGKHSSRMFVGGWEVAGSAEVGCFSGNPRGHVHSAPPEAQAASPSHCIFSYRINGLVTKRCVYGNAGCNAEYSMHMLLRGYLDGPSPLPPNSFKTSSPHVLCLPPSPADGSDSTTHTDYALRPGTFLEEPTTMVFRPWSNHPRRDSRGPAAVPIVS